MNKAIIRVVDRDVTPNHPQIIYQRLTQYSDVTDLWAQYMMTRMEYPGHHVEVDGGEIQIKSQFTYDEETMDRLDEQMFRNAYGMNDLEARTWEQDQIQNRIDN